MKQNAANNMRPAHRVGGLCECMRCSSSWKAAWAECKKERKRCPQYTTESMAAEDAAEAAAALRDSRDVDQNHWIPGFSKARASMMA